MYVCMYACKYVQRSTWRLQIPKDGKYLKDINFTHVQVCKQEAFINSRLFILYLAQVYTQHNHTHQKC